MIRALAFVFALALALVSAACASRTLPPSAPSPLLSRDAPEIRRPTIDGRLFDTNAHRGKVVVVKFFASYCEPCTRTLPEAERLHRAHPDVVFVGIDEDEYERTAHDLVSRYGLTFPRRARPRQGPRGALSPERDAAHLGDRSRRQGALGRRHRVRARLARAGGGGLEVRRHFSRATNASVSSSGDAPRSSSRTRHPGMARPSSSPIASSPARAAAARAGSLETSSISRIVSFDAAGAVTRPTATRMLR